MKSLETTKPSTTWIALSVVFSAGFVCAVSVISPAALRAVPASSVVIGFLVVLVIGLAAAAAGGVAIWQWQEQRTKQERWERATQLYALAAGKHGEGRGQARHMAAPGNQGTVLALPVLSAQDDEDEPVMVFGKWGAP